MDEMRDMLQRTGRPCTAGTEEEKVLLWRMQLVQFVHCEFLYLGAFVKWRKATISFVMSVCPSAWNNSAPTERIFMKFDTWVFFKNLPTNTVHSRHNVEHVQLHGIAKPSVCWLEWQAKHSSLQKVLPPIYQITAVAKVVIPLSTLNHVMYVLWLTVPVHCSLAGLNSGQQDLTATMYIQQTGASLLTTNHNNGGTKSPWNTEFQPHFCTSHHTESPK